MLLAVLLGSGLFISSLVLAPMRPTAPLAGRDLANGSILFVPPSGNRCRQRAVDNATWLMRDVGEVDCDAALSQPMGAISDERPPTRFDVVRGIFRKK